MKQEKIKYKGLTKKQYKKQYACTTPSKEKGFNCKATQLDKAIAKYPRSYKTMTNEYISFNLKKDKLEKRNSFFTRNFI